MVLDTVVPGTIFSVLTAVNVSDSVLDCKLITTLDNAILSSPQFYRRLDITGLKALNRRPGLDNNAPAGQRSTVLHDDVNQGVVVKISADSVKIRLSKHGGKAVCVTLGLMPITYNCHIRRIQRLYLGGPIIGDAGPAIRVAQRACRAYLNSHCPHL